MCPLCLHPSSHEPLTSLDRTFTRCAKCRLIYVASSLSPADERQRYDQHRNDVADPAYRAFLEPTAAAIVARVPPPARGLDFGAGPGPALARMLEERGYGMSLYDVHFHPDPSVLDERYDFIVCTETAEHFRDPRAEFGRFQELLRPAGWLAIRTELYPAARPFSEWHYPRDPTHISIFTEETLRWIAGWLTLELELPSPHLALFRKGH